MPTNNAINSKNRIYQVITNSVGTRIDCTTVMPSDDTIPQNTEGDEVLTVTITPVSATSQLEIQFMTSISQTNSNTSTLVTYALFQDATLNALTAQSALVGDSTSSTNFYLSYIMTSGTTSATTFKIRVGAGDGTSTVMINGRSTPVQVFNGVAATTLTVKEIL